MSTDPLFVLAGIVAAGVTAQIIASRLRVPSIVPLLAVGLLLGPVGGLLDPSALFGELLDPMVSLAVALVLFEGGLSLRFREARKLGWPLLALVVGGMVVALGLGTAAAHWLAGLSWPSSALLGAILVVTGPTVVKPLLRYARLAQRPARLLRWEGIVNDPFGALLAMAVLEAVLLREHLPAGGSMQPVLEILARVGAAAAIGAVLGALAGLAGARGWVAEHLRIPAILAAVLAAFAASEAMLHESGLLAVTVMGVVLANMPSPGLEAVRHFKEDVATMLIAFLFVVLAAGLTLDDLTALTPGAGLFILALLFVVRPASVWISLAGSALSWREKLLVGWIAPRGVVAAAMAAALAPDLQLAGYDDARMVVPVLFGVIIVTVVAHGVTIGPLARRLDLAGGKGGGLLLVGATTWGLDLARALEKAGAEVLVVDNDHQGVTQARLANLEAWWGDVLHEDMLDDLPLERVNLVLAATRDDRYNKLASLALAKTVGRDHVLQLTPHEGASPHLMGRTPWGEAGTYEALSARYWSGRHFRTTALTGQFDGEAFRAKNPDALVLFALGPAGLRALAPGADLPAGSQLVWAS